MRSSRSTSPSRPETLTERALNRALLARQGLLQRRPVPALALIEQLVGIQAQVPSNPYLALWSRIADFDPAELGALIESRQAVRAGSLRGTIHLLSADDAVVFEPLTRPVFAAGFRANHLKHLGLPDGDAQLAAIVAAGRELLAAGPLTRAEISDRLASRWPDADPAQLGHAVVFGSPVVQVPPRGLWGQSGQPRWALAGDWLQRSVRQASPSIEALVRRYLGAFGPASVADARTWSRISGLRAVFERLRPELRTFQDERGRELFDLRGSPLPDPETPAPVRFLAEYDNVILAHDDRSRVLAGAGPGLPFPPGRWIGTVLYDGFYRANWRFDGATVTIDRFQSRPGDEPDAREQIEAEGLALARLIEPAAQPEVVHITSNVS